MQALFAACRVALSGVARGTRRRRLNGYDFEPSNLTAWVAHKRTANAFKRVKDGASFKKNNGKIQAVPAVSAKFVQGQVAQALVVQSRPAKRMDSDKWPGRSRRKPSSDLQPGMRARMTK